MQIEIKETKNATLLAELNEGIQSLHMRMYPNVFKPYNKEAIEKAFENMLKLDHCIAYLAFNGEEVLGYMLCFIDHRAESPFTYERYDLYIDQVFVREEFRGKGISKALFEHAKAFAENMKMSRLHIDHWNYNEEAGNIFEKMGFETYRIQKELRIKK